MTVRYQPIVVTGFMGSGKTSVSASLARALRCEMVDLDHYLWERSGRSPREIIDQDGEATFRALESLSLAEVLAAGTARIIALGGGAWIFPENRTLIAAHHGLAVWLDVPFEVCWRRIAGSGSKRPLARDREQARELYQRRKPIYQLAELRIETNESLSQQETASRIVKALSDHLAHR